MQVKIVSDGTRAGTTVVDAETGEGIEDLHLLGVRWEIGTGFHSQPIALLTTRNVALDAAVEGEVRDRIAELENLESAVVSHLASCAIDPTAQITSAMRALADVLTDDGKQKLQQLLVDTQAPRGYWPE